MPHDISHQPPSPVWVIPTDPADPRDTVRDWLGHLAAGRIGSNPPPPLDVLAQRLATAAQFARLKQERRA